MDFRQVEKWRRTGSVQNETDAMGRPSTVTTVENREKVQAYFIENPTVSQRRAAQELNIKRSSLQRIMAELDYFPYKIQLVQPISVNATAARVTFCNQILAQLESKEIDLQKIWFTDEAHFNLEGYVNKQNMRYWGQENPHMANYFRNENFEISKDQKKGLNTNKIILNTSVLIIKL